MQPPKTETIATDDDTYAIEASDTTKFTESTPLEGHPNEEAQIFEEVLQTLLLGEELRKLMDKPMTALNNKTLHTHPKSDIQLIIQQDATTNDMDRVDQIHHGNHYDHKHQHELIQELHKT